MRRTMPERPYYVKCIIPIWGEHETLCICARLPISRRRTRMRLPRSAAWRRAASDAGGDGKRRSDTRGRRGNRTRTTILAPAGGQIPGGSRRRTRLTGNLGNRRAGSSQWRIARCSSKPQQFGPTGKSCRRQERPFSHLQPIGVACARLWNKLSTMRTGVYQRREFRFPGMGYSLQATLRAVRSKWKEI